ncbi:MAG: hypothetical protein HY378_00735 [Candidatus Brennerbacteria bacterium]|nr:hypothetical protein [Candidatus Brennerbacteria bacterium]
MRGQGQIALPFILLVSGVIVEVTIAGSFITYFLSTGGLGERLALRASAAAHSGIRDAMIRISRDKSYASSAQNYNLTVGDDTTAVSVSRTVDNPQNSYIYTITSTATASSRQRKLKATVIVSQTTGFIQLQSLKEEPVS